MIREEFEKAFVEKYPNGNRPPYQNTAYKAALFGAIWALQETEKLFITKHKSEGRLAALCICQLLSELYPHTHNGGNRT